MSTPPSYRKLLDAAFALGRADGTVAARCEPLETDASGGTTFRGRTPEAFARYLWGHQPGAPPSGLELNAPLWYAAGYAEGLAAERRRLDVRRDAAAWEVVRQLVRGCG